MSILGDRIKEYRKVNNLTQQAFSKMLSMGRSTLSQIESGDNKGTIEFIHKLSKVTNKSISFWIDDNIETDLDMPELNTIVVLAKALHENNIMKDDGKIPELYKEKFIKLLEMEFELLFAKNNAKENNPS